MTPGPWTTADIGDLTGKTAVVTGANAGLGFATTVELVSHGAHVVIASRNAEKAAAAESSILARKFAGTVEVITVDLADLGSIETFAATFKESHDRLDLLINNAGIMMVSKGVTVDGFERQFGTNHLGHFALTGRLFDLLTSTEGARVVTVSSLAHRSATMDLDDLMFESRYRPQTAYGRSKLANLLFTFELQRRCDRSGTDLMALAAHPGVSATELGDHLMTNIFMQPLKVLARIALQNAQAGAQPTLRAATDPDARGGDYFGPAGMGEVRGRATRVKASKLAYDEQVAHDLWDRSQELTGVRYP